jgi:4-hydroxy 2-oxovalerate aldolase
MLSSTCSTETLVKEALKMKTYGARGIIIMDSTGSFIPSDVTERITALKILDLPIGFHGHDNFRLAVANSLAAIESGATIIDVTMKGFGAGAGNTPLEVMATLKPISGLDNFKIIEKMQTFIYPYPVPSAVNLITARYKLVSVFDKHIIKASKEYGVPIELIVAEMAERQLVAGQEDFIRVIAINLNKLKSV